MENLKVEPLKREFVDGKTNQTYPDVNPSYSTLQVRDFLANQYPHLINANIEGPEIGKNSLKYKFVTSVGTKG
jgi:PRTRC genetic system protein C